jgi:geranylgeranyl transferase type-2 subunit beta
LLAGAATLPHDVLATHRSYVIAAQNEDGGWSGREGASDLYYTGFALRSLAILGELTGDLAHRASTFLQHSLARSQSIVDLISLIYGAQLIAASTDIDPFGAISSDWRARVVNFFETLRRDDGGFAKAPDSLLGSSYQTFLVVLCRELLDAPVPCDDPCIGFLNRQRQEDGGFLEVRVAKRSGTNPTAAAAVALHCLGAMNLENREQVCNFLLQMQTDDGGFAANQRMPMEDMLSTFTALVTLWELEHIEDADLIACKRYASSMAKSSGGFAGFALDPAQDVEYTFYGLGTLALIAPYIND